ncbi:MAG: penicillin-binding protein 2 [bacterium]|nr:penicillin-binding protein 2 [bacterium]
MFKKELFLEEAVLDDLSRGFDSLEQPISRKAFKLLFIAAVIVITVVIARLFFLGWWQNDFYKKRALANAGEMTVIRTQRGIIFDRFNKPLVKNLPAFHLNLKLVEFFKNSEERPQTIKALQSILNLPPDYIEDLFKNVNLERQNILTVARQLTVDQIIKIKNLNLPAVQVEDDFERQYPEVEVFSHLLGYTGPVSKADLGKKSSLSLNDIVGKNGLELYYDTELRGEDGETINYRNAKGEIIDNKLFKKPEPGHEFHITIDAEFQSFFYNRLKQGLNYLGSRAGVGIALNPQNGEVLALVSLPSFDNNKIKSEDLVDSSKPLFNRAVSGFYAPGSTIKPLVAFGALKEGIIAPEKEILSIGYIEIPNPYHPDQPSRFVDWKPHGWVNLYSALARSSNVYFYEIGGGFGDQKGLGIEKLKDYWQKFGLGDLTGIDLPGEAKGFLPDPETKEKKQGEIWRIGDTYNVSIGQGDLLVTPLQLINFIAAIANGGKIYQPFIVQKIVSEDGKVIKETNPKIIKDYSLDIEIIKKVQKGMIDGVEKSYGTSHLLAGLPVSVAGKTGTSQVENKTKTNAFFVGYSPKENPQIAILVLVEDAREGSINTVPIAKDALNWYYTNRIKNNEL